MASVGEVTFVFKSLGTLFDDRSLVALLELKDADVDLERQADGLRNWRLNNPENRGPGKYLIQRWSKPPTPACARCIAASTLT